MSDTARTSTVYQARLAEIGEKMNFKIWLPKNDRLRVCKLWQPEANVLLSSLPLNYNSPTLNTIEQIDVIWIHNRTIVRAFEVEDTTTVTLGIVRMANLMALQPNIQIKAHIIASSLRRTKVIKELSKPFLENTAAKFCSFISYDSITELSKEKRLKHMNHTVLEEYAEYVNGSDL
jgi:hypothetical protein